MDSETIFAILVVVILFFLFYGEPDVFDALRNQALIHLNAK